MRGFIWTGTIWGLFLLVLATQRRKRPGVRDWLSRENLALALALLGTHTVAGKSDIQEVLQDPVVAERVLRGALAAAALLLVTPLLLARLRNYRRGHRAMLGLAAYLGIAVVSVSYSAAPVVTVAKAFELAAGLAAVAAVALGPSPGERLRSMLRFVVLLEGVLLGIGVIGFYALPSQFAQAQSRPGFLSPLTLNAPYAYSNSISAVGALIAAFSLARFFQVTGRRTRLGWLGATALGTAGTILASGRQGVAIWLASTAIILFIYRRRLFLLLLAPATAVVVSTYWSTIFETLSRNRPQNFGTITGRLFWWEAALQVWWQHPWTGYGYGAGGRFVALRSIGRLSTTSVHSGYLEALAGVGLLGAIPLLYVVLRVVGWSIKGLLRMRETDLAILIVPLLLRTAVSLGFGAWLDSEFVLFACLAAIVDQDAIERVAAVGRSLRLQLAR